MPPPQAISCTEWPLSSNDVWAVGYYTTTNSTQTLTMHWDGSQWTIFPSPNPGTNNNLLGVTAISSNDVWAAGNYQLGSTPQTLAIHWDGTQWTQVPAPSPGFNYSNIVNGIGAISANDIWIVRTSA